VHYDIETYQHFHEPSKHTIHKTYIVGYTDAEGRYSHFTGDDSIKLFVDYITKRGDNLLDNAKHDAALQGKKFKASPQSTLYLNAFNGANFDHYEVFKELILRGLKPDKQIINNGSIISLEFANVKCIDVSKHLLGTLSQNLKSMGCKVQKGDIDHDLSTRWEETAEPRRAEVIKYLRADVEGLKELFDKVNTQVFTDYQMNLTGYISTSSMTFNQWKKGVKLAGFKINLPTLKQEEGFRESVRGGRTYKSKHRFSSEQYNATIATIAEGKFGDTEFDSIQDYLIDADVVSLYPAAMIYEYPIGDCLELPPNAGLTGKMGIYYIKYEANKNIAHSIGGRREDGALKWDLKDSEGWYTSIDIEDMLKYNYKVDIIRGWYWLETACVFKEYIEELYKKKGAEAAAGRKGSVKYTLAKLWMNGLYGKNIQRPIYTNTVMINSTEQYWKFWGEHTVTELTPIETPDKVMWMVSGNPRLIQKKEKCITKPTQMGAFILAYSRRMMLNYITEANPAFEHDGTEAGKAEQMSNDFYYTDTDSLQMHMKQANLIKRLGDKTLGGITDDLGDGCKIIRGIWIAPKLYSLEYVKKGDCSIHYHLRGKGLDKRKLKPEHFIQMDEGGSIPNTKEFQMKKIHTTRNSKQKEVPQFSILHYKKENDFSRLTRTVNKTKWNGRDFIEGGSIPMK
jgi:hypothetical protein